MNTLICAISLVFVFLTGSLHAQIYADVKTSKGDFTIELYYVDAPKAVANFIRLAEGTCNWVDSATGQVKMEAYYNGVIFHRVITGFMSQTGSPNGQGTDGPGYNFQDEFSARTHTGPYVVSMANSGPHSNGSQFFITAASKPQLDNVHTVFGSVILYDAPDDGTTSISVGRLVCDSINAVGSESGVPSEEVVIQSISIRRVGVAANAFEEHAQDLPEVEAPLMRVAHENPVVSLVVKQPASSLTSYSYSSDMRTWQFGSAIYRDSDDDVLLDVDVSSLADGKDKLFFNKSQVKYDASEALWPRLLTGRVLSLVIPDLNSQWGSVTTFTFTSEGGGSVSNDGGSGSFTVVTLGEDWLGSREYIETNLKYTYEGKIYDVYFRLRLARDLSYPAYFQGRHGGSLFLVKSGSSTLSGNTSGSMTLTR